MSVNRRSAPFARKPGGDVVTPIAHDRRKSPLDKVRSCMAEERFR